MSYEHGKFENRILGWNKSMKTNNIHKCDGHQINRF